jgi:hypothetical protein
MVMGITWSRAKLLLLIFTFLLPIFSYAQKYSVGVKAGPLLNWSGFGDSEDKDLFDAGVRVGYSAGALISFPLKHEFDFFAEAAYSQKGRRISFFDGLWTNKSTYQFIDLTMLLRKSYTFRLEKNIPSQWYFNIGPEISYWIKGEGEIVHRDGGIIPYEIVFNEAPDGNFNKMYLTDPNRWLFGLALGVGFKAPLLRNQHISTEFRFVSGHTFLGGKKGSQISLLEFEDTQQTNLKVFYLNVAYTLDFDVQQQRKGKSTLDKKMKNSKHRRRR